MVTNCFCFDLKYGYLAYASISVTLRTAFILFFYSVLQHTLMNRDDLYMAFGPLIGWNSISSLFCFLAIAGIIKDRSILVYAYIVILISEIVIFNMFMIVCSFLVTPLCIFGFFMSGIFAYDIMCLISLYKRIQNREVEAAYENIIV